MPQADAPVKGERATAKPYKLKEMLARLVRSSFSIIEREEKDAVDWWLGRLRHTLAGEVNAVSLILPSAMPVILCCMASLSLCII